MIILLHRARSGARNVRGIHAAVVSAADESAARDALAAKCRNINVSAFDAVTLDADGSFENGVADVQLFEGDAITQTGIDRGGSPIS